MTMEPNIPDDLRTTLEALAERAKAHAKEHYVYDENGYPVPVPDYVLADDREWGGFESQLPKIFQGYRTVYSALKGLILPQGKEDKAAKTAFFDALKNNFGTAQYSFLALGGNAFTVLMRGKKNRVSLLRFASNPNQVDQRVPFEDSFPSESPFLTLSFSKAAIKPLLVYETMPLVILTLSSEEKHALYGIKAMLYEGTCFRPKIHDDGIGLLPDGTLITFDCGEERYTDAYKMLDVKAQQGILKRSYSIIQERLERFNLSDVFNPFDREGFLLKQNIIRAQLGFNNPEI